MELRRKVSAAAPPFSVLRLVRETLLRLDKEPSPPPPPEPSISGQLDGSDFAGLYFKSVASDYNVSSFVDGCSLKSVTRSLCSVLETPRFLGEIIINYENKFMWL